MPPLRRGLGRRLPRLAHEARENMRVRFVVSGREQRNAPHPVELYAVRLVFKQIFAHKREVRVKHLLLRVVEPVVAPFAAPRMAIPRPKKVLSVKPHVGMKRDPLAAEIRVVDVVHAHRMPHLHASCAAARVATGNEVRHELVHPAGAVRHRKDAPAVLVGDERLAAKKRTAVLPDRYVLPQRSRRL